MTGLSSRGMGCRKSKVRSLAGPEVSASTLKTFISLEKDIARIERRNVVERFRVGREELDRLQEHVHQLEGNPGSPPPRTGALREYLSQLSQADRGLSSRDEGLVDSLNKKDLSRRELETARKRLVALTQEQEQLQEECERLQDLYVQRDRLLDSMFQGVYGSALEDQLDRELEDLDLRRQHVTQAFLRWTRALDLVRSGREHLGAAVSAWRGLVDLPLGEEKFMRAAEARDGLMAALRDLHAAQRTLPSIAFPYCTPFELETLERAMTYVFTDMQYQKRHSHALSCYQACYKRAGALTHWIEKVLNTSIQRDLAELTEESRCKAGQLRRERIRLIRLRVRETKGGQQDLDDTESLDTESDDTLDNKQVARMFHSNFMENKVGNFGITPSPDPVSDLASLPSNDQIFGKIDELTKQHALEMEEYERFQRISHARMVKGLEHKLQTRRTRRTRIHDKERASTIPKTANSLSDISERT